MNPFESLVQVLFHPRRYYSRPHRYEEALFWAALIIVVANLIPAVGRGALSAIGKNDLPMIYSMVVLAAAVTSLSVTLYLVARFFGGVGDFETAFSGAALALFATIAPLTLCLETADILGGRDETFALQIEAVTLVSGVWLLVMLFQNLWLLHAMPWWKALLVLGVYLLACVPVYGGLAWLFMGLTLVVGLLMTLRRPG